LPNVWAMSARESRRMPSVRSAPGVGAAGVFQRPLEVQPLVLVEVGVGFVKVARDGGGTGNQFSSRGGTL